MIISEKQQAANRQNARYSTGPKTPEGKAAVRLNALTYGLRARSLLIPGEDPTEYQQLWSDLEAEWQPRTRTERIYLEQMATSQWLLARVSTGESRIYEADIPLEQQLVLLGYASTQRMRLERGFTSAMRELKKLQKERRQTAKAAHATATATAFPHPDFRMCEGAAAASAFRGPTAPDSR